MTSFNKALLALIVAGGLSACSNKSPEELMQSAQAYSAAGDYDAAVIELKSAVSQSPNDSTIRMALANAYVETGDTISAVKEFNKASELGHSLQPMALPLTRALYYSDQFEVLIDTVAGFTGLDEATQSHVSLLALFAAHRANLEADQQALSDSLTGDDELLHRSFNLARNREHQQAREALAQVPGTSAEKLYIEALIESTQGNHQAAADALAAIDKQVKGTNSLDLLEVEALLKAKAFDQASAKVDEVANTYKNSPLINLYRANLHYHTEDFDSAFSNAEKAVSGGIDTANAQLIAGMSAFKLERWETAYRYLSTVNRRINGQSPIVRQVLAVLELNLGYREQAASTLQTLDVVNAVNSDFFSFAGMRLAEMGDKQGAREAYRKANEQDATLTSLVDEALLYLNEDDQFVIEQLTSVVEQDPNISTAWIQLAMAHVREGDITQALDVADKWAEVSEASGKTLRGRILMESEDNQQAIATLTQVLEQHPGHRGASLYLLQAFENEAMYDDMFSFAKKTLDIDAKNEPVLLALIRASAKLSKLGDALTYLDTLSVKDPSVTEISIAKAMIFNSTGEPQRVVEVLKDKTDSLTPFGYMALGDAYIRTGNSSQALAVYQQWAEQYTNSHQPLLRMLGLYELSGQNEEALRIATNATKAFPEVAEFRMLRGNYLTKMGRLNEADAALSGMTVPAELQDKYALYRGQLQLARQEYTQAEENLQRYYESNHSVNSAILYIKALLANGKNADAQQILEHEIGKIDNPPPQLQLMLADLYVYTQDFAKAEKVQSDLLEAFSDNALLLNNLANTKQALGKTGEAVSLAKRAVSLDGENANYLDTLGWLLFTQGQRDEAYEHLSKASELSQDPVIGLHFAELLVELNFADRAKDVLQGVKPSNDAEKAQKQKLLARLGN